LVRRLIPLLVSLTSTIAFAETITVNLALSPGQVLSTQIEMAAQPDGDVLVTLRVSDPDHATEGELRVNGSGPVVLFGADGAQWVVPATTDDGSGSPFYPSLDGATTDVTYLTPQAWWRPGSNTLEFRGIRTNGYAVTQITTTYSTAPPEPMFGGIASIVQDSDWEIPLWVGRAVTRGDWSIKIRTSTTPDWWYFYAWNHETLARYVFKARLTEVLKYIRRQREIDVGVPRQALELCDMAFVTGGDAFRACARVYASSTATKAYFYAEPRTDAPRVGSIDKGAECPWLPHAQTATAGLWWFHAIVPGTTDTKGYIRCKDFST
jgi:hypothetical protein